MPLIIINLTDSIFYLQKREVKEVARKVLYEIHKKFDELQKELKDKVQSKKSLKPHH